MADESELIPAAQSCLSDVVGACNVLVNFVGNSPKDGGEPIPLLLVTTAQWEQVHRVNVTAPFILRRELIPAMAS